MSNNVPDRWIWKEDKQEHHNEETKELVGRQVRVPSWGTEHALEKTISMRIVRGYVLRGALDYN